MFDPEAGFMGKLSKITDAVTLAVLWLLCCIPVVTVGAASSALYYTYHKTIRQNREYPIKTFFKAFKDNFGQATGIWLVILLITVLSAFTCYTIMAMGEQMPYGDFFLIVSLMGMGFLVILCSYLFPYQSRFFNTTANIWKNSLLLAIANLPRTILLVVLFAAVAALSFCLPVTLIPAVAVYIWLANRILEKVFRKLMSEEELEEELEADRT
jgi:uncharacterized membrane protein YesL